MTKGIKRYCINCKKKLNSIQKYYCYECTEKWLKEVKKDER